MLDKDVSILVQVAFKEAAAAERGMDLADEEGQARFETTFSYLTESLVSAVKANIATHATATNTRGTTQAPAKGRSAEQAIKEELGGEALPFQVNIKGKQHGPLPEWFLKQVEERGTTNVWDNRDQLTEHPTRPWFRDADDSDYKTNGFWPPKKGGARKGGGQRRAAPRPPANDEPIYGDDESF